MTLRHQILSFVNSTIRFTGFQVARQELIRDPAQVQAQNEAIEQSESRATEINEILLRPSFNQKPLPPEAEAYLQHDNPKLIELEEAYKHSPPPVIEHSLWTDQLQKYAIDLRYFRGDNAYIWQYRGLHSLDAVELTYLLTAYYLQNIDRLGLLKRLHEDELFGAYNFDFNGTPVSRDLLDSIAEIYFLERNLNISTSPGLTILDIGAGYGRLAHRMVEAFPHIQSYLCVDAVALSTFLSDFYLKFRGVSNRAKVIPLYEIENTLAETPVDLAINVHSFSECRLDAIDWWLSLIARHKVKYLFIVPNDGSELLSRESDETKQDFRGLVEAYGYREISRQPKYLDPSVQHRGVHPAVHYLFQLQAEEQ